MSVFSQVGCNKKKTKIKPRKTMKQPFFCLFFCSAMGCVRSQVPDCGWNRINPVMEAPSLKRWATREVPEQSIFQSSQFSPHFFFSGKHPSLKDRIFPEHLRIRLTLLKTVPRNDFKI